MKTYSIGRDLNCDIVINDSTDVISRRHALLNITPSGRMTIIDQSSNGTYVNGIRISQNVPVPVTRKDVVSLAHVAKLDWNQIPKSNQWMKYAIWTVVAAALIVGIILGIKAIGNGNQNDNQTNQNGVEVIDSTLIKQREAERLDSVKKAERQDSIKKVERQDSIKKSKGETRKDSAKTNTSPKNKPTTKPKNNPKDSKDTEKSKKPSKRPLG